MEKKYKNYPGMKMIKRATGSSKVESTMYKAGQKMRNILDKGLLSFIKKPKLPKGMEQSASKPSAFANQKLKQQKLNKLETYLKKLLHQR
jgi:hypothetical protein